MTLIYRSVAYLAALATVAVAQDLATLQPFDAFSTSFVLKVKGETKSKADPPCVASPSALPSACLENQGGVSWQTGDSVDVFFVYNGTNLPAGATTIDIRMCFSKVDTIDRPWRKVGATVAENLKNQCQFVVASGIPAALSGNATWVVPSTTPDAAMFPRIFLKGNSTYIEIGESTPGKPELFLAVKMETTPPGLVAAVAVCASLGPLLLIGYVIFSCIKSKDD